ncbi:polysaccharide deacetylase family protein [Microbacterium sp. BR1]|uniref:polysaccharide deacetylase family protein n=1 Tax=Microbacterium sp. BR1 TaxID=1070896 RepID=UPI000C2B803C|nr:polysaccharide deacetylase family protein [Microbacterium sp. BR1]
MTGLRGEQRRSANRSRKRRRLAAIIVSATVVALIAAGAIIWLPWRSSEATSPTAANPAVSPAPLKPTPSPTPLTPAQALLAGTDDPNACAVSFAGEGIADAPILQTVDTLYTGLPVPTRDGAVFAGWYASDADAAALTTAQRLNGSKLVACTDQQTTLHAGWTTPEANVAEAARIPILMYHQFTTNPNGESGWLRGNYAYIGDFDAQMSYIAGGGFYQPTWDELSAFIDGKLFLPGHSVIVTDDDADQTWFDLAAPVVDKYHVLATSFMITAYRQDPPPNRYVLRRSHTHDMHKAGANGKGEMVNLSAEQIAADLETSAGVLGAKEVIAYPYGHYNDTAKQGVAQAGFEMARTVEPGYVRIGTDKLALPVQRINYGMGVDVLKSMIG